MHATILIPYKPRQEHRLLAWALEGYAQQQLSNGYSFDVRIGVDGDCAASVILPEGRVPLAVYYFPETGAAAVRNALVAQTERTTDLLIFANADARPFPDMVQSHLSTMASLPPQSLVLGAAPWECRSPTLLDVLLDTRPMIFSYCHMKPRTWYPFRVAYTINLTVRRDEFLASGGFHEAIRPYYYEDLAFACRFLGTDRPGVYYEPKASVLHRHPMTFDQYLDREELLGIMAPVVAKACPEAFNILMSGRQVDQIANDFRERLKGDANVYRLLYRRMAKELSRPLDMPDESQESHLENLYQLHIPLKLLAFRVGYLRGMELIDDRYWKLRRPEGLWRQHLGHT